MVDHLPEWIWERLSGRKDQQARVRRLALVTVSKHLRIWNPTLGTDAYIDESFFFHQWQPSSAANLPLVIVVKATPCNRRSYVVCFFHAVHQDNVEIAILHPSPGLLSTIQPLCWTSIRETDTLLYLPTVVRNVCSTVNMTFWLKTGTLMTDQLHINIYNIGTPSRTKTMRRDFSHSLWLLVLLNRIYLLGSLFFSRFSW